MSSVFSKNKEKRQRTSSNESNTSFVKNVTSRVSGLLPSTITRWFSSPSSSNTNGSAPIADATDSSTEDEAPDSPAMTQPPMKRMRYNTPPKYDHFSPADANFTASNTKSESIYSSYNATPFPTRTQLTTPTISPSEEVEEKTERDTTIFKTQHTVSNVGQSVAGKRKSIFNTYGTEESKKACNQTSLNATPDLKQPYFKPALLASPFYPGRTMYGGAASSYVNQPNIKQKKVAVVKESFGGDDSAISTSARRIMDLLEQYSSPLVEARRIPHYTKPKNDTFNNSTERHAAYPYRNTSYKTQELHVPNMASILRLKQKSRLMDSTSAARQLIASHSSALDYPSYPAATNWKPTETEQSNKMTTKVKARVTRINRGNQNDFEVATPVKLQTVALDIDQNQLPKFSFGTPAAQLPATATSTPKISFDTAINKKSTEISNNKEPVSSNQFKFSNPLRVSCDSAENETNIPKYQFYSPERRIEQKIDQKKDSVLPLAVGVEKAPGKPIAKSDDWKCSECWVSNKADANKCVCCGAKQPSKSAEKCAKCTVCKLADSQALKDKCINCEKIQINNVASPVATKTSDASKWKCNDCWVSNDNSAEKCACCGAAKVNKSGAAPPAQTKAPATVAVGPASDWKCADCWISNKSSVDKCAACGGAKPGGKAGAAAPAAAGSSLFNTTSNSLKNIVQAQKKEKWECQSCLVRNEANVSSCVCCGAEKENKSKMPENKFNFGLNNSFKFGINPKLQEATLAKKPELESTPLTKLKEQSEKNNNILAETPGFTLTMPVKKPKEKIESSIKGDEVPKPSFTFGIPKQSTPLPATTAKPPSPVKAVQEEKPQEVPQVTFSAPVVSKPSGGMFSSPSTFSAQTTAPPTSTGFTAPSVDANKDVTSISITLKPAAVSAEKPQQLNTFTFNASSPQSAMFGTPKTTAAPASTNLFAPPSQTTVASTTAPAMSMFKPTETTVSSLFQKPNPTTTSTVSLFQSSQMSTTAAPPTVASTAPIFGFGTSTAKPAPAPEKSGFFSFGNNAPKTDAPPSMFKSSFGAASEGNANNNSFGLSTGNTLGTGNVLGSSSLGSSSVLTGGTSMSSGTMSSGTGATPSNPLGGPNGLPANPLPGGNTLQTGNGISGSTPNLFASPVQKENVWSSTTTSTNLFVPATTTSSMPKPPSFTFGSTGGFNASAPTPAFGSSTQPAQSNIFGMANQSNNNNNNNQPSMFSSPVQSQQPAPLFGAAQPAAASPAPQMGMFGSPSVGATPTFGAQNPSIPSFEAPSMTPTPAPSFNFGGQQSTGMFGFGQQQQPQQAGVYNFGGAPAGGAQVQFNMGSGVNTAGRRLRKAVRRNPPR